MRYNSYKWFKPFEQERGDVSLYVYSYEGDIVLMTASGSDQSKFSHLKNSLKFLSELSFSDFQRNW